MDGQHATDALGADVDSLQKELAKLYERSRRPVPRSQNEPNRGDQSAHHEMQPGNRRNL